MTEKRFEIIIDDMERYNYWKDCTWELISDESTTNNFYTLEQCANELNRLNKENEQLKQQLDDNLQFLIRASKRLGFESLDHLLYTLDKGEITGYSTANWEKGDVE